jgi:hypothetical protein
VAGSFFMNEGGFQQSPNKFIPQGQNALSMLLSKGQQKLNNPSAGFEPIAAQARNRFQRQTVPGLAERFTALGGSDTRGSSDFSGALAGAGSEFEQGLAALQAQYGIQNEQSALNMLQLGLTPQTESVYFGGSPTTAGHLFETGGKLLGAYLSGGRGGGDMNLSQGQNSGQGNGSITGKYMNPENFKRLSQFFATKRMQGMGAQ